MATIKIESKIPDVIGEMLAKIKDREPLMRNISSIMLDDVRQNFEVQGRPPWAPLAQSTIKERQRLGYWPGKILQRTGQLLKSITSKSDNDSAQVGTNKIYAAIHQFGGIINQAARSNLYKQARYIRKSKKGKFKKNRGKREMGGFTYKAKSIRIPPRPFLILSEDAVNEVKQQLMNYLEKSE